MKPTLFLLAAGMGSRYGGLKQLDTLGPQGQSIMDYSIYDAIQAGFGKIVWVIRRDFEEQFRTQILSKYEGVVPCELCFQSIDSLPAVGLAMPQQQRSQQAIIQSFKIGLHMVKHHFCKEYAHQQQDTQHGVLAVGGVGVEYTVEQRYGKPSRGGITARVRGDFRHAAR